MRPKVAESWHTVCHSPFAVRLIVIALLAVFFAQAVTAIPQLSLTADEPVYVGAGYAFLRSGDLRMATQAQHPPLIQELTALPLLLQPGPELDSLDGWRTAEMSRFAPSFVAWYGGALDAVTFAARIPVLLLALLWGASLFRWAADWFGPWGGVVALTLFVFDPNILAHATLATNDVGFAAFSFIAVFAAMRLIKRQSWRYLVLAGLALGASLSAKSSGFFTALVLAALLPLSALFGGKGRTRRVVRSVLQLLLVLLLGLLVLWATYGFEFRPVPMATQWEVWREMRGHLAGGHTAYLMGRIEDTGWLTYYPLAFALKTPPVTLVLLTLALVTFAIRNSPFAIRHSQFAMWVYLGGYTAATLLSTVNTGYRFLLPILPFCFLLIAGLVTSRITFHASRCTHHVSRFTFYALLLWHIIGTIHIHPHYLTYFNFLAGGPEGGHRYLVDSNLDWGQSFQALKTYLDEQGIEQVWLSYYTYTDPLLYGINYQPIAPAPGAPPVLPTRFNPAPGVYAIGATTLQGVMLADPDTYSWFHHQEPLGRPGNGLFVYQVSPHDESPTWLAQCTTPVVPLSAEAAQEGFGRSDLRTAYFDCTSSWLYPNGAESPGWYALYRDTARSDDAFIRARLAESTPSYEQREARALPPFAIYEQVSPPALPRFTPDAPIRIGHLTFLGYTGAGPLPVEPGRTVEIETWWRVDSLPERPLSIMLHLAGSGSTPVVVGDGLGVPIESWQIGDVIVQRHALPLPADAPPGEYTPTTGVYWLDTMERWKVGGAQAGDQLTLPSLVVTAAGN